MTSNEKATCHCGQSFSPAHKNHKHCSERCRKRANRRPWQGVVAECDICSSSFVTKRDGHIYCSRACNKKAERDRWRKRSVQKVVALSDDKYKNLRGKGKRAVYCFQEEGTGLVKIGVSSDWATRLNHAQTHNPRAITVAHVVLGSYQTERILHKLLAEDQVRGEWFSYSDRVKLAFELLESVFDD